IVLFALALVGTLVGRSESENGRVCVEPDHLERRDRVRRYAKIGQHFQQAISIDTTGVGEDRHEVFGSEPLQRRSILLLQRFPSLLLQCLNDALDLVVVRFGVLSIAGLFGPVIDLGKRRKYASQKRETLNQNDAWHGCLPDKEHE